MVDEGLVRCPACPWFFWLFFVSSKSSEALVEIHHATTAVGKSRRLIWRHECAGAWGRQAETRTRSGSTNWHGDAPRWAIMVEVSMLGQVSSLLLVVYERLLRTPDRQGDGQLNAHREVVRRHQEVRAADDVLSGEPVLLNRTQDRDGLHCFHRVEDVVDHSLEVICVVGIRHEIRRDSRGQVKVVTIQLDTHGSMIHFVVLADLLLLVAVIVVVVMMVVVSVLRLQVGTGTGSGGLVQTGNAIEIDMAVVHLVQGLLVAQLSEIGVIGGNPSLQEVLDNPCKIKAKA